MDAQWFKRAQKRAGVTSFDLGQAIGRDRTVISRFINGGQRMTLDQARLIAPLLDVPLTELIEKAGLGDGEVAQQLAPGFAESDATPYVIAPGDGSLLNERQRVSDIAKAFGGGPGVDIWRVKGSAMALAGLLDGDLMLVDTHQAERVKPGDVVLAQIYSPRGAATVLRRFEPPVLVASSVNPSDMRVHVVDGVNVVVRGKIIASWRR